jgi:ABC-type phosphate transport system substrate-binding protein
MPVASTTRKFGAVNVRSRRVLGPLLVLTALLTALVVLVAPGSAAPVGNVESWGTYGVGQGQYANATMFGVDPSDGSVYVGDMTEKTSGSEGLRENFRIQKFSSNGTFQASVLVPRFYDPPTNEEIATLFGVAIDPTLHRLYLLEGAKDPTTKEPYGQRILVYSTTPEGTKLVAPTGGPSTIALPTTGTERILNPTSIAVDPKNHEVEVFGESYEPSVEAGSRHPVLQRVTSTGSTGPRFTDTANKLAPALERAKMITVAPSGITYAITGRASKGTKTKLWELPEGLTEVKEVAGFSATAVAEEWTFGLEQKVSTYTGGPELAISPDGETLYWKERIEAWSPPTTAGNYLIHGYSLKSNATTVDYGGATSGSCKITSADAMFGVTGEGASEKVVVLDPGQTNEEEQQAPAFGGKVLTFGRGGTGCPVAEAKFKVNGVEEKSEFAKGTTVTFDASSSVLTSGPASTKGFVKEVIWKFGDGTETVKTSSGSTEAALTTTHAYANGGTYKPTLQIRFKKPTYGNPALVEHTVIVTGGGGTEEFALKVSKEGSGTVTSSPSGINCGSTCEAKFAKGTLVKLTATPETGFKAATFTGCDTVTSGVCEVTMSAAKEVKATFAAIPSYLLKVKKEGTGGGTVTSSPTGINCGSTCESSFAEGTLVKLTATPEAGSKAATFTGCDAVTSGVCEVTMSAAKEVKATFALEEFSLKVTKEGTGTVTSSPAGIACGSTCEAKFAKGTLVKLTATPEAGFKAATFTGCDTVTSGVCEVTMSAAKEVKATFAAIPSFLLKVKKEGNGAGTVTSSPTGINCGSTCESSFAEGTLVKLTATPEAGSKAATFTGCDTVTGGVCEVTMNAAKEVKATFALEEFALKVTKEGTGSVSSSPAGINCGTECQASYAKGTSVKLTATPGAGFKAATWTGCDTVTGGVCEVTMTAAKEVKATFAAIPSFLLKVKKEGNGVGTVSSSPTGINCGTECEASYAEGTLVKLTATPGTGSKAATFTGCDNVTGGVCEVTMNAAKEVKATFALEEFSLKVTKEGTGSVSSSPAGINCGSECQASYTKGTLVKLTATPGTGFKAATWTGCDTVTGGVCEVTLNAAKEVKATFAAIPNFLLKVKKEGNGSGTVTSNPTGINCGAECEASYAEGTLVKLTATPGSGSKAATFTGCDNVAGGVCEVTMNAAKEVKATFSLEEFSLKVSKDGNGTVTSSPAGINCGSTCEAKFTSGTLVKLTATPGTGYKGVTWTGCDNVTSGVCEVTVNAASEVKATFVPVGQFVLKVKDEGNGSGTVTSSPSGINCGPECEASFAEGTLVKLTAAPGPGSKAATWTGCDNVAGGVCEVTMNAAKEVKATFALEMHTLKVSTEGTGNVTSSPSGINCGTGSECEAAFNHNTVVKLTGVAGSGFKAPVWTGCDTVTGGVCEVTINAAKEVKATFVPVGQYLLKVKLAGAGSGTVTSSPSGINCGTECEASYVEGTLVKLTATPGSGSKAAVFSGCDSVNGGVCEVTMNAAKSVTATFEAESTSPVDCSGSDIGGAGSTLQGPAQTQIWIPGFKALCPSLTVNYEASSSAAGLAAWGFKGGSFDKTKEFIATDEAPDSTEIGKANTASGSKVLTIPVAQTAIGIVVNPPTGCTISGLTNKQLESIMRGNIKTWAKIQTASGAGCVNAPITRVVRAEASGTTYQMKNYLFKISEATLACTEAPGKNWKQLEDSGTNGQPNTVWPQNGVNGCSATQLSPIVTGAGGAGVVKKVNTTEGSIGYAALPDIEANKNNAGENPNGDTSTVALQDNGLSNKLSIAKFAAPAEGNSANCSETQYPVPTSAQTTSKEPANADWSQIFGGNTNAAAISPGAYSLCALTYDIALTNYSKAGFTAGQETTAHSYLAEYLTAEAGQNALEAAGKYYAPLPDGGNPLHDIIGAAHYAASKIGN